MNPPVAETPSPPAFAVFVILLASYAFFWHARDWNSASRLMLTYSIVDRGTVSINGLEDQTRDRARIHGRYYSDKLPGFSLLGTVPYAVARSVSSIPVHPIGRAGFAYWPADYWVTLGTSGVATALCGALLTVLAARLGCGPRSSALIGLAYGLATPAYVYATMSYGHQVTAFLLLLSFAMVRDLPSTRRPILRAGLAGMLAAIAVTVELQVAPAATAIGLMLAVLRLKKGTKAASIVAFGLGAVGPALVLLAYNTFAFGSPLDMGYFHEDVKAFSDVHSKNNPLGLKGPDLGRVVPLLVGGYRGLFFYAPIVLLAVPGWVVWAFRDWLSSVTTFVICALIFLVNLSYPEWTGGWSTGPRLLVPLLPFAMLAVAALIGNVRENVLPAGPHERNTPIVKFTFGLVMTFAVLFALAGGVLMLLFQGAGGQVPQFVKDPLMESVLPCWAGATLPGWHASGRFTRNVISVGWPDWVNSLGPGRAWMQFGPLVAGQVVAIGLLMFRPRWFVIGKRGARGAERRSKPVPE